MGLLVGCVVDVDAERVDSKQKIAAFLVANFKIRHSVHLQVLRDLQIFQLCIFSTVSVVFTTKCIEVN